MKLEVVSLAGKTKSSIDADPMVFDRPMNESLVHEVVVSYMHNARQGTVQQKTRAMVRGGGAKPWRQKGTGRARAGTIRSPLWRGGGIIFAAQPRDYYRKINRKVYRHALRVILSELRRQNRLVILDNLQVTSAKTKDLLKLIKPLELNQALITVEEISQELGLASRNIPNLEIIELNEVNPVSLLRYKKVCFTVNALKRLEEQLQ